MTEAYQALCELWASLEYQEKLEVVSGTRVWGRWIRPYGSMNGKSSYIIFS
jgi:hypothetical protein